jgi:MoaA/NifB/PqqE/SkfB family radical SAM enzyme
MGSLGRELHYQYRCLRLAIGFLTGRFIHCNLQVTYRCNMRCSICDFWKEHQDPAEELSLDDIRLISRKLGHLGTLIISVAGGEPLIRSDICRVIAVLRDAGHFPIMITNGWFVDESLAREMLGAGLQEVSVSVDYCDPKRHDAMRGLDGAWDGAVSALDVLRRNRPDPRVRVHMISVLMDDNLEEVEPLIKLSRELGVTYMLSLYSSSRGSKEPRRPDCKVTDYLLRLKARYPEFVTLTSYIQDLDTALADGGIGNCQTGRLLLNVDHRGFVARCTETLDQPVGNILTDDVMELRRRLHEVQARQDCAQCWTSCRGFAESMTRPPRLRQLREFYASVQRH